MKKYTPFLLLFTLSALFVLSALPAVAQDGVILQVTAPFFAEDILQPVIDEYQSSHPGVTVQLVLTQGFGAPVQNSDDAETYQQNLATYFSSADILVVSNSVLTPEATRGGYVLDLKPLTSSDVDFDASAFHSSMLEAFQWDNGQWALPISASFIVVSYIPDAFDQAGLAYPDESWTLDDLENAARTLTQKNPDGSVAVPGMIVQGNNASLPPLFMSLTGSGFATDSTFPGSPDFSSAQLAADLDSWYAFTGEGLMEQPDNLDNSQIPIIIGNPQFGGGGPGGFFGNQNQNAPERATALLPGGRAGMSVNGYAISRGTLYPQESYDFLKFLVNHPNAVTANLSTAAAVIGLEAGGFGGPGGPGGGPGGPGGGFVPAALQPLLDTAIERSISDTRFSSGITGALNLMESEGLDARAALDEIQNTFLTRLSVADTHAATVISVVAPTLPPVLAAGEVALNFALLGGGPGGGGFAQQQQWDSIGKQFADQDAEVGLVKFNNENPNDLATVAENYDCFYSGTNLVPDADLSLLLSFDPLVSVDPAFDPDDFIAGVFTQVKANNQMYAYPLQISPLVLRFNPDIFNQAGVPLPQSDWTVNDLQDALGQLKFVLTDDQFPLELNNAGQTAMLMLIAAYGGIPFDTRTSPPTISFTDSATEGALQQVLDLLKNGELTFSGGGFGPGGGGQTDNTVPLYSNVINAFSFGFGGPGGGGGNAQNQNTDGIVPFPRGNQYNAVAFNLGTAYISASSQNPEACYRFISYVAHSTELFDSMPARYSQIDNPDLAQAQGNETVAFYHDLANLIDQPTTLVFPNNINAGNFGMTNWLFQVFDRYVNGEVTDLNAELTDAEQSTKAYLDCVAALPPFNPGQTNPQDFFAQIQQCQASATV